MINAMRQAGLDPAAVIADGKIHRFDVPGDRAKSENGWYVLFDGDIQSGRFGSWKTGQSEKWCSKSAAEFTPEEKKQYAARMEAARRLREAELAEVHAQCKAWCQNAWDNAAIADSNHPYLLRKQVISHGLRQSGDALMVPVAAIKGGKELSGIQFIQPDGTKKFKTGTAKQGNFHIIGLPPKDNTMIICEGYATGASIHQATSHTVLVAFDAGNLKPVAEFIRKVRPEINLIIAADNDQWTDKNPGISKATEAAHAVNGDCRVPRFENLATKPTDFNDLFCLEGAEAVKRQIFPPPMAEYAPHPADDEGEPVELDPEKNTPHPLTNAPFQLLGYDHDEYYFLPDGTGQIKALTAPAMTVTNFMTLAPLTWWEREFPGKNGVNENQAKNMLIQTSHDKKWHGIFDADKIRGLGAWEDKGRSVLHLGDTLVVNGERITLPEFKTKYIYERALSISDDVTKPLPAAEANKLIQLCNMLSWEKSINGRLLAGWCIASIICGALKWRPHMWLTGPSGSGKSWIIHNIIKAVAGPHIKGMLGSTTEAGLRNALKNDAFSVFFDEFEAEDKNAAARIQSILEFARPASSNEDSKIYKAKSGGGGVHSYQPRSCIGLASVNVNMSQKADISRVTVLGLVNGTQDHFDNVIVPFWEANFTASFLCGLRSRAISLIPVINKSAEVFQKAVTTEMKSRRGGDQYGAMLACAYSLCSGNVATIEQAREFVGQQDWDGHTLTEDQGDELQCLSAIFEGIVRYDSGERSIGELLQMAEDNNANLVARETLIRHGVKHVLGGFVIANKHSGLSKILEKTPWAGNWSRILARIHGACKEPNTRFSGGQSRAVSLPIRYVKGEP